MLPQSFQGPETPSTTTTTTTTEPSTQAPPPSRKVHYENKFDDLVYDADGFSTSFKELAQKGNLFDIKKIKIINNCY